eukprot:gnl/TRDRNA2_/TRDRNA2_177753_c0_seq7.p1 gnl/TRDRNA2_/TRDRNA2_177753_c0~~gnl/TRDRNA2_/TRDRNA2_177753_c0_seq7.p1  ORF type:complete len:473 (+),score=61.45 gnl/TRDRNA2_/TRDRNA2_177753_c0_seq7:72-1490(+)
MWSRRLVPASVTPWIALASFAVASVASPPLHACDVAQHGYHILEKVDCGLLIWRDALRTSTPIRVEFRSSMCIIYYGAALKRIEEALDLAEREPYQQPWRCFTPQGHVVDDGNKWTAALNAGEVFLLEGGQFQWPPVRVGFRQQVDDGSSRLDLETLALRPPIFKILDILSDSEAQDIITYAKPRFKDSSMIPMKFESGDAVDRTSVDYRPRPGETATLAALESRIQAITRLPENYFEAAQILKYDTGGHYYAHYDASDLRFYSRDEDMQKHHYGFFDRMLTLFVYLNTVPKGGETNFPWSDQDEGPISNDKCYKGLMVRPVQGTAILWYNLEPDGLFAKHAQHAACNVGEGLKFAINYWGFNKQRGTKPVPFSPDHPRLKIFRDPRVRSVLIENAATQTVELYWKSPNGEVLQGVLAPGERKGHSSFVGHIFLARSMDGKLLGRIKLTQDGGAQQILKVGDEIQQEASEEL